MSRLKNVTRRTNTEEDKRDDRNDQQQLGCSSDNKFLEFQDALCSFNADHNYRIVKFIEDFEDMTDLGVLIELHIVIYVK